MSTPARTPATRSGEGSFELVTPAGWVAVPPALVADPASVRALISAGVPEEPALESRRTALLAMLAAGAEGFAGAGVAFAAILVDVADVGAPLIASVTLAIRERAKQTRRAAGRPGRRGGVGARETSRTVVRLPAGPALRVERLNAIALPGGDLVSLTLQFTLNVPGTDDVAMLTFSSPTLTDRDGLVSIFDEIAASLSFDAPR